MLYFLFILVNAPNARIMPIKRYVGFTKISLAVCICEQKINIITNNQQSNTSLTRRLETGVHGRNKERKRKEKEDREYEDEERARETVRSRRRLTKD